MGLWAAYKRKQTKIKATEQEGVGVGTIIPKDRCLFQVLVGFKEGTQNVPTLLKHEDKHMALGRSDK